jgi:2-dehydro-3-deoxygluconokinase
MEKTIDVAGLGEGLIEFNQVDPALPQYLQGFGGDTSNAIIAAARAGARCAYVTRVGRDGFGDLLLEMWREEGIDVAAVDVDERQPSGVYFVTHGHAGHTFSYLRAGSAASHMFPGWIESGAPREVIAASRILHVSGISMGISASACDTVFRAMELCRELGTQVSLDANLRLKLWPAARAKACIVESIRHCDIFLPSLEDAVQLSGLQQAESIVDWAHDHGAPLVILKLGAEGALASDGRRRVLLPAHKVRAVDASGAGDCFSGNLLAKMARGMDIFSAARYGNAAASLAVQGFGAVAPLPGADAVRRIVES